MPFVKKSDARNIFIGRTGELLFFGQNILKSEDPTHNIISIWGQGGVGKSTLLAQFLKETRSSDFKDYCVTAVVDERQVTPAGIMEKFADQLSMKGDFEKALRQYKEVVHKLQTQREATLDTFLGKTPELAGSLVGDLPVAGKILKEGVEVATEFFANKYRYHQLFKDAERLEDPIGDLTKAFVEELNRMTEEQVILSSNRTRRQRRVILFFDTFEQLATEVAPWLLDYFLEASISSNVVLVVAGRDPIDRSTPDDPKRWLPYRDNQTIYLISLNSFTKEETHTYLEERGITDMAQIDTVWQLSHGLPLYLGLLTSNVQGEVDPTKDVVDNFLRWIPEKEQTKRRLALDAALLSRPFNQDDLEAFTYLSEHDRPTLYRWLTGLPFVRSSPQDGRHSYHDVAQDLFSRHLYQGSQKEYYTTRLALANYYQRQLERIQSEGGKEIYHSASWLALVLALTYQMFLLPDEPSHISAIEQVLNAYKHTDKEQEGELIRVLRELSQEQPTNQANLSARQDAKELLQYIEADLESQEFLAAANYLLEKVAGEPAFSSELLARIYRNRGRTYSSFKEYRRAIEDFDRAIELDSKNAEIYVYQGIAYSSLQEYQRAFEGFDQAIALDPQSDWAYAQRGETYRLCKEYKRAIEDFDRAIELDPKYAWAYACRAHAYSSLEEYKRAIKDLDQALALAPSYTWAYAQRGETYRLCKEYQRAIEDFDKAVTLDPKYAWAYACRAHAYSSLEEYERAIKDLDQALTLDPKLTWAYIDRGEIYRLREEYQQAIEDFDHALALNPKSNSAYYFRGLAYRGLKEYEQAINNYTLALEQDPKLDWAYAQRGETYRLLKEYRRAIEDFDRAIELDPKYAWAYARRGETNRLREEYQRAIEDFDRAIELDPNYARAYAERGVAYRALKTYDRAIEDFDRAIELDPNYAWAYGSRGQAYSSLKEYDQSIQDFDHALKHDPKLAWVYDERGLVHLRLRDIKQACIDFTRSFELDPMDLDSSWGVEWSIMCLERTDPGIAERLEVIAMINPKDRTAYVCRGAAFYLYGKSEEARAELEQAIMLDSKIWDAYFWKGMAYASLGQDEDAIAAIEESLELDLPPILLTPLCWFEQDRPDFYKKYVAPLLARYEL